LKNPSPHPLPKGEGKLSKDIIDRCRELRKNATDAEKLLWQLIRIRQIQNAKFRRQYPIAGFILDFFCFESHLAIELDGSGHLEDEQTRYDRERTEILNDLGIRVIRFWNNEVLYNTEVVLQVVADELSNANPSPPGRG
jgi:very-short-patch-repair endonuclease